MIEFMYLLGGLVLGIIVFVALFQVNKIIAAIIGVLIGFSGVPFAFIKPHGYSIPKYMKYKKDFKKKQKKLPNKRNVN